MKALFQLGLLAAAGAAYLASFASPAAAQEHWVVQYQYRDVDSTLTLNDLSFPDKTHGIACGYTTDRKGKDTPLVLVTNDAGNTWSDVKVKDPCLSLFFLPDTTGWMVTDKDIWYTEEGGRNWSKMKDPPDNLLRVWFFDHRHGFAAGRQKHVFETKDGGATWTPLAKAGAAPGDPTYTTYGDIEFSQLNGIISGWDVPPTKGGPAWMDPTKAQTTRQVPHMSILLQTKDGGVTWKETDSSIFGQITRMTMNTLNMALGLVEFKDEFDYPSEVYRIDLSTGKSELAYRDKTHAITDIRLFPDSTRSLLAGFETSGPIYRSPIPGKLKVLTSSDNAHWTEMPVDYRAVAHSAVLTGPDDKDVWIGTDTGMILKLEQ
jgi:hypothetical protein